MKPKSSDKKWLFVVVGGSVLLLCLLRLTPTHSAERSSSASNSDAASNHQRPSRPGKFWRKGAQSDAPPKPITHQAAHFTQGEQLNILVDEELQMGGDPTFVTALGDRVFGVYVSPEETAPEPFNTLIANYDVTTPENSELNCAFRIRADSGEWSDWREISAQELNKPVLMGASGLAWQYRLTFYASPGAASPRVRNVTVTTRQSDPIQLGMNSSAPFSPQATPLTETN